MNIEEVLPQNTGDFGFSKKYLLGELARWSVNQSPYYVPDNLETVLRKVSDLLPTHEFNAGYGIKIMPVNEFHKWFFSIIQQIPELVEWNVPKSGHKNSFVFCCAYSQPKADDDIVDLYALVNNVKLELIKIWRRGD